MKDRVTDISTGRRLEKWMGGVETDRVWARCKVFDNYTFENRFPVTMKWGEWELLDKRHIDPNKIVETVPAFSTDDLIERLPKAIPVERWTGKLLIDFTHEIIGYHLKNMAVRCGSFYSFGSKGGTLLQAAAQLVIFCGESGYLEEGKG